MLMHFMWYVRRLLNEIQYSDNEMTYLCQAVLSLHFGKLKRIKSYHDTVSTI
jgi:hypothetical protein